MFKLLFLKKLYDLSDETLISSAQTDMAYKFFLDLEPEAKMIDPSLLTKFRMNIISGSFAGRPKFSQYCFRSIGFTKLKSMFSFIFRKR